MAGEVEGPSREQAFDAVIESFISRHHIPGAVVVFGNRGVLEVERGYGVTDGSTPLPLTPEHRFRLASLSKPITAAAILALIDADKFKLDTTLVELLPWTSQALAPRFPKITVRNLLQHRGGWDFGVSFDPFFLEERDAKRLVGPLSQVRDCRPIAVAMLDQKLQFSPGERYAYSNLGYCWLGLIIEQVTEKPYEQAVRDLAFPPNAGLSLSVSEMSEGEVSVATEIFPLLAPEIVGPAGGWQGRARDFFAFASGDFDSGVMQPPSKREHSDYYGLGWRIFPDEGPLLTHYGAIPGAFSLVLRDVNGGVVVALFNGRPSDDWSAFLQLKRALVDVAGLGH